ncbi:helix-turn-helix domain-containing protein [Spirillospora sp. NPDC127200]
MPDQSPTVRQRRLARELRGIRERAELTPEQAATILGWSRPKLVAIETAKARPRLQDVERMLELYGPAEPIRMALLQLARDAHRRGWWSAYGDVLTTSYPELEDDAENIKAWQTQVVPGLLQTDEYALTLIRGARPDENEESHLRRLAARATRRTLLSRSSPPAFHAVLDEAVLHRTFGAPEMMRRQLAHLRETAQHANVCLQVVPAGAPAHPGVDGPFVILGFEGPLNLDVAFVEGAAGVSIYLEDVEQVTRFHAAFDRIGEMALSPDESLAMITSLHER